MFVFIIKLKDNMALSKQDLFEKMLGKIGKSKTKKVRAAHTGYANPEPLSYGGHNAKKHHPDIVVEEGEQKDIYAIVPKLTKVAIAEGLGKWILFSIIAKQSGGKLFLVVYQNELDQLQNLVSSKQISAELVAFPPKKK